MHGRKSEFEMKMLLKFGSYLITHLPVCSVCVRAPWPGRVRSSLLSDLGGERGMFHLHIPATLNFQQPAAPEGKELSTPIYLQSESQTWSQQWFNVRVLSAQSICSKTAALALPETSQNRLSSAVKRDSAISYHRAVSLLPAPLCRWKEALVEACISLRCRAKPLCRRAEMSQHQRGLPSSASESVPVHQRWVRNLQREPDLANALEIRSGCLHPNSGIMVFPGTKAGT